MPASSPGSSPDVRSGTAWPWASPPARFRPFGSAARRRSRRFPRRRPRRAQVVCSHELETMTPGIALDATPGPDAWPRRLVCVCLNAAVDKVAAVDRLVPGEIHRPEVLSVVPGGKALNVARAAATLGMPVRAVAVLGGNAGDWMDAALRAREIATHVVRAAGETRTCLSVLDRAAATLTEFYEPGLTLDAADWAAAEAALRSELDDDPSGSLVVLAGSLPPGAPLDGYARLATIAEDAGARSVVDADRIALAAPRAPRQGRSDRHRRPNALR